MVPCLNKKSHPSSTCKHISEDWLFSFTWMDCVIDVLVMNNMLCRDVSYNNLQGNLPSWISETNLQRYVLTVHKTNSSLLFCFLCFSYITVAICFINTVMMFCFHAFWCSNLIGNNFTIDSSNSRWISALLYFVKLRVLLLTISCL